MMDKITVKRVAEMSCKDMKQQDMDISTSSNSTKILALLGLFPVSRNMTMKMVETMMTKVSPQRNGEEGHSESETKLKII